MRLKRLFTALLLAIAVFSGTAVQALAASTELPVGLLISDQDGIKVSVSGAYFINAESLEPGDVITKTLVICNTEPEAYRLTMRAETLDETGPLRLLDEVNCTLKLDGKMIYDGPARGTDTALNGLDLGSYDSGGQKTLRITLTVSPEMKKLYWTASEAIFRWHFYAAKDETAAAPKTGEAIKMGLYVLFPALVLGMAALVLIQRRRAKIV